MRSQANQIILLIGLFYIANQTLFSQHISRDNYTGAWETPTTWDPAWTSPQTILSGFDVTINGYITLSGSLSFSGTANNLIVNDTLVIIGNLTLSNNSKLTVNDNGILIIRGDLVFDNQSIVKADGYLVVTRNLIKNGSKIQGSFIGNDNPFKVFIAGTLLPVDITNNNLAYPVLNTVLPTTITYPNSTYGYGNMADIMNDPNIYLFFQNTCGTPKASVNSPVCEGKKINLVSSGGTSFRWSGPNGYKNTEQSPVISNAIFEMAGIYTVTVTDVGCSPVSVPVQLIVNPVIQVSIAGSRTMCLNEQMTLTGTPAGGTFTLTGGRGTISGNVLSVTGIGKIYLVYNIANACATTARDSIFVYEKPVAVAGPDQELKFIFETQMVAEFSSSGTGEWTVISGSGQILDKNSPTSLVTELPVGENIFLWTVRNGTCEASDEIIITVNDLFVPSVITPNGDGKNDYFQINSLVGRVELIIFNRWGNMEYTNDNYLNNWDGRNNNYTELPDDTYFYIVKFENGIIRKGTVLITR